MCNARLRLISFFFRILAIMLICFSYVIIKRSAIVRFAFRIKIKSLNDTFLVTLLKGGGLVEFRRFSLSLIRLYKNDKRRYRRCRCCLRCRRY